MIQLPKLLDIINNNFLDYYQTKLVGGFDEPFYQTHKNSNYAEIQFTHDYHRSALHELAHWCVAGEQRRKIDDYGYWYAQDGRSQEQQNVFFQVEIKPQTIEWAFCLICGISFEASVDNLTTKIDGKQQFSQDLTNQLNYYINNGFTPRVDKLLNLLAKYNSIENYKKIITDSTINYF